jgi:anti-sigma factor RsiW
MSEQRPGDARAPRPEILAGYLDGELDPKARQEVDAWLAVHAEAAAEVEAQRQLLALWRSAAAPEPAAAEWHAVLARVEAAVPGVKPARPRGQRRAVRRLVLAGAGLAAALVLVFALPRSPAPNDETPLEAEPFAVVAPDDVEIVRIHADDRTSLVVGRPPLEEGTVEWVARGDVEVQKIAPDTDGMVALVALDDGPIAAMIMAPADPLAKPAP